MRQSPEVPVATVNNVKIGAELMEMLVANNVAQGAKDSPELRAALKTELIAREVLAQEAKKQNLDKDTVFKTQMLMQQNTLLVERLIAKQFEKLSIPDDKLRAEYKRQVELLADAEQYQVSHIVTASEADADRCLDVAQNSVRLTSKCSVK